MESSSTNPNTGYQQVVVDVPEDRVAEFHALLARFLAGPVGRGRRGRRGGPHGHRGGRGRHCHAGRAERESDQPATQATEPEARPTAEM